MLGFTGFGLCLWDFREHGGRGCKSLETANENFMRIVMVIIARPLEAVAQVLVLAVVAVVVVAIVAREAEGVVCP